MDNMKDYIGTKQLKARPMTRGEYNDYRGWLIHSDENGSNEGYLVEYLDGGKPSHPHHSGYISWSPADVFERNYKPCGTYIERLNIERDELTEKINKLRAFISNRELAIKTAGEAEYDLLTIQLEVMKVCKSIICTRLSAA